MVGKLLTDGGTEVENVGPPGPLQGHPRGFVVAGACRGDSRRSTGPGRS